MKELHGRATASVSASLEVSLGVLAAVERYPEWYPEVVRRVRVIETAQEGWPSRAEVTLHVARGPLVKDLDLLVAISVEQAGRVVLTRIPHGPPDGEELTVSWRLDLEGGAQTRVTVELAAKLSIPRFIPLGDLAETFAEGFAAAAVRAIEAEDRRSPESSTLS